MKDTVREYVSFDKRCRMQVTYYGDYVRAAVCDGSVMPTAWFYEPSFEDAIRRVTREYGTAWVRTERTHIGW